MRRVPAQVASATNASTGPISSRHSRAASCELWLASQSVWMPTLSVAMPSRAAAA
jgi:hypothetical protein